MSTEFNSNINLGSIKRPANVKPEETAELNEIAASQVDEELKSDGVPVGQIAVAGKSQIKTDNVATDTAKFLNNPEAVTLSDTFFDKALVSLTEAGDPDAYAKACQMTAQFVEEISSSDVNGKKAAI